MLFVLASEKKVSDYVVLRTIKVEYLMSLNETFFLGLWGHEIKFSGVKKSSKSNRNPPMMPLKLSSFIVFTYCSKITISNFKYKSLKILE